MKKTRKCPNCKYVRGIRICKLQVCPCEWVAEKDCPRSENFIDPFKELFKKLWEEIDESAENKSE